MRGRLEHRDAICRARGFRISRRSSRRVPRTRQCVGMKTPDEEYYVSIDMPSAMHPQTLLAYEMNGAPLTVPHGAPLRLVMPVKYGIKNIKQIGSIEYTDARPRRLLG